ncbi:MAG: hypothetical protein JSV94_00995 [Methanobacteriota archaeon]|nr:MAG: hypothetical protein JSV94_00995 [Euryarchaeota archaeon]
MNDQYESEEEEDEFVEQPPSVLERIVVDSRTNLVTMRWIGFLIDKAGLEALPELFRYYCSIGWISEEVEIHLSTVADGLKAPIHEDEPELVYEEIEDRNILVTKTGVKKKPKKGEVDSADDWRLTPEDHLKSWLFILEIAGIGTDKNLWYELRQKMDFLERGLDEYCQI